MGATDGGGSGLGHAEVLDLAGLDQLPDRARDLLDRYVGVDPVLIEQVDRLDPQPLQRGVGDPPDVVGPAGQARLLAVLVEGEPNLVAMTT